MEAAKQESNQLAVLEKQEYLSRIAKLNEQLIRLQPNSQSLRERDVGFHCRKGDCLFEAIRIQRLERCQQLPGCDRHDYLASAKAFQCAIIKWVHDHMNFLKPIFPELADPNRVSRIAQSTWGVHLGMVAAATLLRCQIQVTSMNRNAPIDATLLWGPAGGPLLVLGWMNDKPRDYTVRLNRGLLTLTDRSKISTKRWHSPCVIPSAHWRPIWATRPCISNNKLELGQSHASAPRAMLCRATPWRSQTGSVPS